MYDKGERYYEDSLAYDVTPEDVDMEAVKAYMQRIVYSKSPMEYLAENKNFVTYKNGIPQVSAACVLLFGKRPHNFFPRARVRFIRYYGTEEKVGSAMNVVKDVTFEGRILDQINKTVEYLETQVKEHSYLGENGLFRTVREYPKFVIQEMVVNSVCHRDYSIKGTEIQIKMFDDRLVFETPGRLPGIVRTDNIRHTHFSRNPKIAEYLKAYDFVKEFGEGVDRMCRELTAAGTREPQYHLESFILKATVYAHVLDGGQAEGQEGDTHVPHDVPHENLQSSILRLISQNNKVTREQMACAFGVSTKTIGRELKKTTMVNYVGSGNNGHWEILNLHDNKRKRRGIARHRRQVTGKTLSKYKPFQYPILDEWSLSILTILRPPPRNT